MTSGAQICLVSPVNRISRSNGLIVLAERYYWVKNLSARTIRPLDLEMRLTGLTKHICAPEVIPSALERLDFTLTYINSYSPHFRGYVGYRALPSWDIKKLRSQLDVYVGQSLISQLGRAR
jgi:NADPH-dependent 2,4-dienoyl-CoA reductase/sulfur reductase-like enzyme